MISDKNKFIFVHLPKTAGTSMALVLKPLGGYYESSNGKVTAHMTLSESLANNPERKNYYKFTCIRNIYDRMVSLTFSKEKKWDRSAFIKRCEWRRFASLYFLDGPVDYIMRFDNLDEDWQKVSGIISKNPIALPKTNVSPKKKHYSYYYDDELKSIVDTVFADEIEKFEWEFKEE